MFEKVNNRYALRKTKKGLASLMIGMLVVSMGTTVVGATELVEDGNNEETHAQVETDAIGDIMYVEELIDFGDDYYPNPSLEFGEHVLEQAGHHGTKSVEYIETEEGYVPTGVETVLVEPQNNQVAVGNYDDTQVEIYDRGVEYVEDPTWPLGETHIIRDGSDGERQIFITYEVDPTTGILLNPTEKFDYTPPVNRVVAVGTLEVEETPELLYFSLMVKDGNDITELAYEAETYEEAEQYFHDYVSQNFLDPVEWSYNERFFEFTATIVRDETPVETDTYTLNIIKGDDVETVVYDAENVEDAEEYFENHVTSLPGEYTMAYDPDTLTFSATLLDTVPEEPDRYILKRVIRGATDTIGYYGKDVADAELHFKNHMNELGLGDYGYFEWTYDAETLTFTATLVEGEEPSELDTYTLSLTTSEGTSETTYEAENAEDAELHFRNHVDELGLGDFTWSYDAETLTFSATLNEEEEPGEPVELDTYTLVITSSEVTSEITFEAETAEDAEVYFKNHINKIGLGDFGYFEWTYDAETLTFTATFVETDTYTLEIIRGDEVETVEYDADTYGEAEEYFKNLVASLEGEYSKTVNIFTRTFTARLVEPENPSELDTYTLSLTTSEGTSETTYEAENAEDAELHFRNHVDELGLGDFTWAYDAETLTFSATLNEEEEPEEPEEPEVPVETETYSVVITTPDTVIETSYDAETAEEAEEYFRDYANRNGLTNLEWSYDAETLTFNALFVEDEEPEEPEEPEVPVEYDTYKLNVITPDTRITTEIEAEDATTAEQYFRNYVNRNGLGDLVWSYDAETLTFTAILEETPEEPVELNTYKLYVNTPDTVIETSYDAETAEEAEKYFRNYVNSNGLGDLVWSYDAETLTFTAILEETPEEPETPETPETPDTPETPEEQQPVGTGESKDPNQEELPPLGEASSLVGISSILLASGLTIMLPKKGRKED